MRVVGLMSGTSVDAIDAALAELDLTGGVLTLRVLAREETSWPADLRRRLLAAGRAGEADVEELTLLHAEAGEVLGRAAQALAAAHGGADLVCSHGQTVNHVVNPAGRAVASLQIGDPARIHEATALPVIADVRATDLAAGGDGAPLAPLLDVLLASATDGDGPVALVNIGGIANATIVDPHEPATQSIADRQPCEQGDQSENDGRAALGAGEGTVAPDAPRDLLADARWIAGDIGPGNCLLDAAAERLDPSGPGFDRDGRMAARGTVDQAALDVLLSDPLFTRPFPLSTGREHFHARYARERLADAALPVPGPDDLMATLLEVTARTVADRVIREAQGLTRLRQDRATAAEPVTGREPASGGGSATGREPATGAKTGTGSEPATGTTPALGAVRVSGGGARNPILMERLAELLAPVPVTTTSTIGMDPDAKESLLMCLIGFLSACGLPGTLPLPDRPRRVLGTLTPPTGLTGLTPEPTGGPGRGDAGAAHITQFRLKGNGAAGPGGNG